MCHMSGVTCQVSGVMCHLFFFILFLQVPELVGEGLLSPGATPLVNRPGVAGAVL